MRWSGKHKNLLVLLVGISVALFLSRYQPFITLILGLGGLGYLGAFIAGSLYTFSFTIPTSILMLSILSQQMSPIELGVIGAMGGVITDFTIFRFVRDDLVKDIESLYKRFGGDHVSHVFHSRYFHWTLPFIGALIIASPFPDEIGVTLMGISKMKAFEFIPISFIMNFIGIIFVVSAFSFFN